MISVDSWKAFQLSYLVVDAASLHGWPIVWTEENPVIICSRLVSSAFHPTLSTEIANHSQAFFTAQMGRALTRKRSCVVAAHPELAGRRRPRRLMLVCAGRFL